MNNTDALAELIRLENNRRLAANDADRREPTEISAEVPEEASSALPGRAVTEEENTRGVSVPPKRRRGRPRGSGNKTPAKQNLLAVSARKKANAGGMVGSARQRLGRLDQQTSAASRGLKRSLPGPHKVQSQVTAQRRAVRQKIQNSPAAIELPPPQTYAHTNWLQGTPQSLMGDYRQDGGILAATAFDQTPLSSHLSAGPISFAPVTGQAVAQATTQAAILTPVVQTSALVVVSDAKITAAVAPTQPPSQAATQTTKATEVTAQFNSKAVAAAYAEVSACDLLLKKVAEEVISVRRRADRVAEEPLLQRYRDLFNMRFQALRGAQHCVQHHAKHDAENQAGWQAKLRAHAEAKQKASIQEEYHARGVQQAVIGLEACLVQPEVPSPHSAYFYGKLTS